MKKYYVFIVAAFAAVAGGCASKASYSGDIQDEAPVEAAAPSGITESAQEPDFSELSPPAEGASGGLLDFRVIYFDYDKSVVPDGDLAAIGAHSDYLNRTPGRRVILEGHADERGSNEYNLALGQRRADAVRDIMLANGVQRSQIETLSFGEESPSTSGQNESAWAENRRVEIRYHNE
ncbi:MAG: peptidoglycan-associated lipoprotein Pal [Betaproteobacteria bacterium]|nr:peptidoglycan-associated lipoprotein Pal [Betaproteobacteria bacterium]